MADARKARMGGWLSISTMLEGRKGRAPEAGGLIEVSGTGARIYMTRQMKPGERIPLVLHTQKGKVLSIPVKVMWGRKDEPGNSENLEVRIQYLRELLRLKVKVKGMPYGYVYGVRFEKEADATGIRLIQKALSEQRTPGRESSFAIRVPDVSPDLESLRPK